VVVVAADTAASVDSIALIPNRNAANSSRVIVVLLLVDVFFVFLMIVIVIVYSVIIILCHGMIYDYACCCVLLRCGCVALRCDDDLKGKLFISTTRLIRLKMGVLSE
jgi:hypothetical protein